MLNNLWRAGIVFLPLTVLIVLACGGEDSVPTPTLSPVPTPTLSPTSTSTTTVTDDITVGVISTDLSIGPNRLAFFLLDNDRQTIRAPKASVQLVHSEGESAADTRKVTEARFRPWPLGELGIYTSQVNLERAGGWEMQVDITKSDGSTLSGQTVFPVQEISSTPAIGSPAPLTRNKTSRDVNNLEELTTASSPDPSLYAMTIEEAITSKKSLVVVFATPAFCQTSTCGPQVEVISELKERYQDEVNFIHVEVFDNPHEIQGDLSLARTADAVAEWGLPTEPWTFVVDGEGQIYSKFEAFTTAEELEEQLNMLLR